MADYDVLVVGARCAGAPLATLLARQGARVALVERATFPRDTLSSHIFEADALAFLDRLGLTERVRATGAPYVTRMRMRVEDLEAELDWPQRPGDVGGIASVRRLVLDPILADAAAEAGADVRLGTAVTELLRDGERVAGVWTADGEELRARLVVGADGRNSTVGGLAGARRYNLVPNQRILYWGFFEGVDAEPAFLNHRWADRFVLGIPSDGGLYHVLVWPEKDELPRFRADRDDAFLAQARACAPLAELLDGARRVGRLYGALRWTGFFREASGPGWVLTGDAGHFKDPGPGRGIGDAFLQAERLAPEILDGLAAGDLDRRLARWGRWRDREFAEHYWLAEDTSASGTAPAVLPELLRALHRRGRAGLFFDMLNHRASPSQVLTPPRIAAATARAVARRRGQRAAVVRETAQLLAQDLHRRWLNRRPRYEEPPEGAGATEVDEESAA